MSSKGFFGSIGVLLAVIVLIIGAFIFIERVPEGKVAVVYTPSEGASRTLNAGWHRIGFFEKTQQYPTRITIVKQNISVTTSDGKKVTLPMRYEYKVDKTKVLEIFKELGSQNVEQIQEGYLTQRLFKASRETVSGYSVIDIYGQKTSEASAEITERMAKSSEGLGFMIADVTVGTPKLDDVTQKAIDERVKAAQELEKLNLETQIAQKNAEKAKIEAKGKADAEIEVAKGRAESIKLVNQALTPEYIKFKEAEARMKFGWLTVQGADSVIVDAKDKE